MHCRSSISSNCLIIIIIIIIIIINKITDTYKIDHNNTISQIKDDILKFANKLHIKDRLGKFKMKDAYILFKDHIPNFENKLQSRLISSSKTELGIISENIIQNIVLNMLKPTHNNLWKNSTDTIEWFRNIKNKSKNTFI